jgi:hypothetical protein
MDAGLGTSDPYCVVRIGDVKHQTKVKKKVSQQLCACQCLPCRTMYLANSRHTDDVLAFFSQTLDPAWNEQFEFTDFRLEDELVVEIYDW